MSNEIFELTNYAVTTLAYKSEVYRSQELGIGRGPKRNDVLT